MWEKVAVSGVALCARFAERGLRYWGGTCRHAPCCCRGCRFGVGDWEVASDFARTFSACAFCVLVSAFVAAVRADSTTVFSFRRRCIGIYRSWTSFRAQFSAAPSILPAELSTLHAPSPTLLLLSFLSFLFSPVVPPLPRSPLSPGLSLFVFLLLFCSYSSLPIFFLHLSSFGFH